MSSHFGQLLRSLREACGTSQRSLSEEAEISARHVSWLETGKARPSRQMVLLLGSALDLPLRDRNRLLLAADFAPAYTETALDEPAMDDVRRAIDLLLRGHEPYPAVVMNRSWDVVYVNQGFSMVNHILGGVALTPFVPLASGPNLLDAFFSTYRSQLRNADELLANMLPRLRREALHDPQLARRLASWLGPAPTLSPPRPRVVIPIEMSMGPAVARMFTTFTALGSPMDLTTDELTIEMLHPADPETAALFVRELAK